MKFPITSQNVANLHSYQANIPNSLKCNTPVRIATICYNDLMEEVFTAQEKRFSEQGVSPKLAPSALPRVLHSTNSMFAVDASLRDELPK